MEGNFDVFKNLAKKARLLDEMSLEHQKIRPLLIVMGGVMRGVAGGHR